MDQSDFMIFSLCQLVWLVVEQRSCLYGIKEIKIKLSYTLVSEIVIECIVLLFYCYLWSKLKS